MDRHMLRQLDAMHTLACNLALYYSNRNAYCRFCKCQIKGYYPRRGHDPMCPLTRIMEGDIPPNLRRHNDAEWDKEYPVSPQSKIVSSADLTIENLTAGNYMTTDVDGTHTLHASLDGISVIVRDAEGNQLNVLFSATSDRRTVTAYVEGTGYIGGWRYPHRAMPLEFLVDSINLGKVYEKPDHLPNRYALKTCPHCGGVIAS